MGRDFTAADDTSGAAKVAIIGYGTWQRDFGGAADILGKGVRINGKAATVIGVMPKGFAFPTNEEIYLPLFSEFPPKPRNDPATARGGVSRYEQAVQHRSRPAIAGRLHAAPAARNPVDDARFLRRRPAHLVRERDEHAVRPRDAARQGAGCPILTRRIPKAPGRPDAHRKPA